jgi:gluconate 2-dehydrogenase gamma chain
MSQIGINARRRSFLRTAVMGAPAVVAAGVVGAAAESAKADEAASYSPAYFSSSQWQTLNQLVDVLIPVSDDGPGGLEAGVAEFIDQQMDTPYGHGELWYMDGPHDPQAPALMGYQLSYSPRDLYAKALDAFAAAVNKEFGKDYGALDENTKVEVMHRLEKGQIVLTSDIPSDAFFTVLLQNVHEGYFSDPAHGGNKDMAAWKMIGFPGARGDYYDWVNQYGAKYPFPPVSIK